jgi:zona occludens toxin (predicted ATPase)
MQKDAIINEDLIKNKNFKILNDNYIWAEKNDIILFKELWEMRKVTIQKYNETIKHNPYMKWYYSYYLKWDKKKIIILDMDGKNIHRHLKRYTDKKIWLMLTSYEKIYLFMIWLLTFVTLIVWYFTYSSYSTFTDINWQMINAVSNFNNNNYFKEDEIMTNTFVNKKIIERFWSSQELNLYIQAEKNKRNLMLQEQKNLTWN